jgi:spore maturation protein SpmA
MLVQSIDNAVPAVGNIMLNPSSNTFGVSGVTEPTADKYSGHLLFIDNKQAFTPTADQTVTLRTVIKF